MKRARAAGTRRVLSSEAPSARETRLPATLAGAFFLSGAAALVYELVWFRMLGHVFGSTATAAATLLAAYLFGLGAGAFVVGRISDRLRRPGVAYVAIELAIGAFGLASHALLQRGAALYGLAHDLAGESPARLLAARFAVSFLLVAVPTTLMGGTFPLMVHLLAARGGEVGRAVGRAYAINTAGAALGTLALPLILLPRLGVAWSLAAAALMNLATALLALVFLRRSAPAVVQQPGHAPGRAPAEKSEAIPAGAAGRRVADPGAVAAVLAGFFLSSFASLVFEAVWARHLGILFGARIHTFAFVLFAYLLGLFAGSALYARLRARGRSPIALARAGLLIAAVFTAVAIPILDRFVLAQVAMMLPLGVSHGSFLITFSIVTVLLILPPAFGFGLVLPAVVDWLAGRGVPTGTSVGLVYAVNTAGTTLGAVGAGFVLVPAFGTQRTLEAGVLMIAAALALCHFPAVAGAVPRGAPQDRARRRAGWLRAALPALFLILVLLPRWDWRLAHARYSKDPLAFIETYVRGQLDEKLQAYSFPSIAEGTEATVSVGMFGDDQRLLFVNGKPDASNLPGDMLTQRLLGCLPILFHPAPKRALVIGLGSGTTVGTLARAPVETIEVAEISPGVVDAARRFFTGVNDRCLDDPRVTVHLDDGRNYLHFRPPSSYDLIVSEPSNPWVSGVSGLFTDEFFADVKAKLRPGGIFCQWFHFYAMSIEHVRLAVRTFARQFPESVVLLPRLGEPTGDMILIGSKGPLALRHLPDDPSLPRGVRAALEEVKNPGAQQLLSGLVAGPGQAALLAGSGPLNTDDWPLLELEAPADLFSITFLPNLEALFQAIARVRLPITLPDRPGAAAAAIEDDGLVFDGGSGGAEEPGGARDVRGTSRGVTVLTKFHPARKTIARWVLVGTKLRDGTASVTLDRMARVPAPFEIAEIASALAGPAGPGGGQTGGELMVGGHRAAWTVSESGSERTVAAGWFCDVRGRGYFATRTGPTDFTARGGSGPPPAAAATTATALASDLAARVSCDHSPGR